jgi:hypothetical protein
MPSDIVKPSRTKFCIWLATESFLYLPIFALRDLKILEDVAKANGRSFEIELRTANGDADAARCMLEESLPCDTIHVAIGDPVSAVRDLLDDKSSKDSFNALRVIGSLLKKPPFWLVSNIPQKEFLAHADKARLVHYNPSLATGYALGQVVADSYNIKKGSIDLVDYGNELDKFFIEDTTELDPTPRLVLTADALGLASLQTFNANQFHVFTDTMITKQKRFLTTGITVHKENVKQNSFELAIFLKACRLASSLFSGSVAPVEALCRELLRVDREEFSDQLDIERYIPKELNFPDTKQGKVRERAEKRKRKIKISNFLDDVAKNVSERITAERIYGEGQDVTLLDWDASVRSQFHVLAPDEVLKKDRNERKLLVQAFSKVYHREERYDSSLPVEIKICDSPKPVWQKPWAKSTIQAISALLGLLCVVILGFSVVNAADRTWATLLIIVLIANIVVTYKLNGVLLRRIILQLMPEVAIFNDIHQNVKVSLRIAIGATLVIAGIIGYEWQQSGWSSELTVAVFATILSIAAANVLAYFRSSSK